MPLSLKQKLVLMMVGLSFILTSLLLILYYQAERILYKNLEAQIEDLSKIIQVGVEELTGSSDEKRLKDYLSRLKSKGIKEVSIISHTDEILASTNPEKSGSTINPTKKEMIIRAELGEPVTAEGRTYNVIVPVIMNNEHYGYLHLKINTEDFSSMLRSNLYNRILVTLIVFGAGIVMIVFLSTRYTRPIQEIIVAVRNIMAGEYNYTMKINTPGEIGELSENIERMKRLLEGQQRLQENLRKAEHLATVGQFAREIAHEVRNPLNFINLTIDHVKTKLLKNSDFIKEAELLEAVKREVHRLDNLVNNFLEYAKPLILKKQRIDTGKLLTEIIELIKAKAEASGIEIITEFSTLPFIDADPDLLKTALMNIIKNAFEAMPEGGTLTLRTGIEADNFYIEISDNGEGIPEDRLTKVFDPFFTTKEKGLGLGLTTTKRIIEEHGGRIFIKSKGGTDVKLIFGRDRQGDIF
ncbi:MAG: ATP-binding protein [Thermodesulfovibrionales bacterium]|nr:ATP-binding protein [Thermodesulfovibrionales bacterium]